MHDRRQRTVSPICFNTIYNFIGFQHVHLAHLSQSLRVTYYNHRMSWSSFTQQVAENTDSPKPLVGIRNTKLHRHNYWVVSFQTCSNIFIPWRILVDMTTESGKTLKRILSKTTGLILNNLCRGTLETHHFTFTVSSK